jgi:hypothetical protein
MIALKSPDHRKIPVVEKKTEPQKLPQSLIDSKILGGVIEIIAKNLEELSKSRHLTEIKVSAPPVREYVIKHVWDKDSNRITESVITVRGDK